MNGSVPVTSTNNWVDPPDVMASFLGPAVIEGAMADTATVAVSESAVAVPAVTRTQNCADAVNGGVMYDGSVPPSIGAAMSPDRPRYHWYDSGDDPVAATVSVAVDPMVID